MASQKKQRLERTVEALKIKHGEQVVEAGPTILQRLLVPPHISTGISCLDSLTGCKGLPIGHLSLLTGRTTSGKLTAAYFALAQAQGRGRHKEKVAILDVTRSSNPGYIHQQGVDLNHTLFVRPPQPTEAVQLLHDLLRGFGLRALLVNGLGNLLRTRRITQGFDTALPQLCQAAQSARCALIVLDEPAPPWLDTHIASSAIAHYVSVHMDFTRTGWLRDAHDHDVVGCVSQVQLLRSRWAAAGRRCEVQIHLPGGVQVDYL
jgi:RecA/RadA recombinase